MKTDSTLSLLVSKYQTSTPEEREQIKALYPPEVYEQIIAQMSTFKGFKSLIEKLPPVTAESDKSVFLAVLGRIYNLLSYSEVNLILDDLPSEFEGLSLLEDKDLLKLLKILVYKISIRKSSSKEDEEDTVETEKIAVDNDDCLI